MKRLLLFCFGLSICISGKTQVQISPASFDFPDQQIMFSSQEQEFLVSNQGTGPVVILPEDIALVAQGAQSTHLSVLTYNIEADDGDWPGRFAYMLEEIRAIDPDVIGLQEVIQRANLDNQAMQMADSLGYYYYFDSVDDEDNVQRYGNAILSRYPIEETNFRALVPLNHYRKALHAKLNVHGNIVDVYNTHLHHRYLDHDIRMVQINDLLDFIEETNSGGLIFVTGDFNANPDWEEMEFMYEDFQDVYPLFHDNHLDPEHATLNHRMGHQMRRIDYVFFNRESLDYVVPLSAEVVLDHEHDNMEMESDHFGVFATFYHRSDADEFVLDGLDQMVELEAGESFELSLLFAPETVGMKQVYLTVTDEMVPVSGLAFDATVYDFPWHEDFGGMDDGQIPYGWEANADNWGVFSSDYAGGEPPEMVFWWEPASEGLFYVKSPPIQTKGLDSLMVSFRHSVDNFEDPGTYTLRLVSIAEDDDYLVVEWEDPGDIPSQEIQVQINKAQHGTGHGRIFLAWVFDGPTDNIIRWAIDDIEVKALPALEVLPSTYDFGEQQIHNPSDSVVFALTNIGGGFVHLDPDDIQIIGDDAPHFILHSIGESVLLGNQETAEVYVVFEPQETGEKIAYLTIGEQSYALGGYCYDPTITELPWMEDFSAQVQGGVPKGWERDTRNWEAFYLNNAGGEPPEMVFWWEPQKTGRFYLKTPEIVTNGMDTLALRMKYRVRNFQAPGQYTLSVISIADGEEYVIQEWVNPESIEPTNLSAIVSGQHHGVGSESFRLAWVFDGITNNIVSWNIDDIELAEPGDEPVPEVSPDRHHFGQQTIDTESDPYPFVIQNAGGGEWILDPDDIQITGSDADHFVLFNIEEEVTLALFESDQVGVSFAPRSAGNKQATLEIGELTADLEGWGTEPTDYFIYCDFSIVENGVAYTNVYGYREVPAFASGGSLVATDYHGEGEFGGVVLKLDYDLALTDNFTIYYMWAYPYVDIGGYTHIVLYMKAEPHVTELKIRMQDTRGIQGTDGASYTYIDVETDWHRIMMPVTDFHTEDWAVNLPDMGIIQKIDLMFEKNTTQPSEGTVYVDLVGFSHGEVDVPEPDQTGGFDLRIYPNPANERVWVYAKPGSLVRLQDINGKTLHEFRATSDIAHIDLSRYKKGMYLVRVVNKQKVQVQKLIIH